MATSLQPQAMHSIQLLRPVLYCVLVSIVVYWIICRLLLQVQHARLQREQGCQPARTLSIPEYASESEIKRMDDMRKHVYLQGAINRYAKFGNTFQTSMFDAILFNTVEPANLQAILANNFKDYSIGERRKTAFRPLLEDAIFNSDGLTWVHSRRLLRPAFAGTREAELAVFERHVDNLITRLHNAGSEVDIQPLFFQMTLDTASDILFGKSTLLLTEKFESSQAAIFADAFGAVQRTVLDHLCVGWISKLFPEPRYRRRLRYLQNFVDQIIEERRTRSVGVGKEQDVRDSYLLDNLDEQIRDPVKLRGQLMSLLVGGRDTTAGLMSNLWHVLVRRPDVQEKLRAEIQHLGQKKPTYQELLGLKYLRYCINESLRLHPPVPMNNRTAVRATTLPLGGGPSGTSPILIPAGSIVGWHTYALHRRRDIFGPDADEFRPERWEQLRPGWAFLPFHGGPRTCLGQQLALTEAAYTTVRLLQAFEGIRAQGAEPWRECLTLTCAPKDGVRVCVEASAAA